MSAGESANDDGVTDSLDFFFRDRFEDDFWADSGGIADRNANAKFVIGVCDAHRGGGSTRYGSIEFSDSPSL